MELTIGNHTNRHQSRSATLRSLVALAALGFVCLMLGAKGARAAECPNEALRIAQSAGALPDCRAYELVSPPDGTPYLEDPGNEVEAARASSVGGGIAWFSYSPLSTSLGGGFYDLSTRKTSGWVTESVSPRLSTRDSGSIACTSAIFFSADLSKGVLTDGHNSAGANNGAAANCGSNDPPLVEGEPEGVQNVFWRDNLTGEYRLIDSIPAEAAPRDAVFQDASDDFSHVVFEDGAKLEADAPPGASLYEWVNGAVSLVTVLPDGTPSAGSLPYAVNPPVTVSGPAPYMHPMSADGTRVVFQSEGRLYMRENLGQEQSAIGPEDRCLEPAKACTVQLDASRAGGAGGGGGFLAANASDTKVFFADGWEAGLTPGTVEGSGQHMYEYNSETGELEDLTPAGNLGLYGSSGVSDSGAYLYLVAEASLNGEGVPGSPNLYVLHEGMFRFIATLDPSNESDWRPEFWTSRVSASGQYFAFNSTLSFTGYDNRDAVTGGLDDEIYIYDASTSSLHCVSCDPSGARPTGSASIDHAETTSLLGMPNYLQRQLVDDGHVFFNTASALVGGAANGKTNVYEYFEGRVSLISSGTSGANSYFYDASANGEDVYFVTTQHLVGGDAANGMRLYDARIDGGFPEPEASPALCTGEGCRGTLSAVALLSAATTDLHASGNVSARHVEHVVTLTRRQKLKQALRACRHGRRSRERMACRRRAQRRYGVRR